VSQPLECPNCHVRLTEAQVITLHRRYASAQRKTKSGGTRGGRRPRVVFDEESEAAAILKRAKERAEVA